MKDVKYFINDYPRPQFINKKFELLNGKWLFALDDENVGEKNAWYKGLETKKEIIVPFSYQTNESGITCEAEHEYLWYEREINIQEFKKDERVILNFEGVDYIAKVWVNGLFVGEHKGGYTRFSFDITDYLDNKVALVVVKAEDKKEATQPRGKQTWLNKPFGCWYTETSGIWKTVWYEIVPEVNLESVKVTPILKTYKTEFEITLNKFEKGYTLHIDVTYKDLKISSLSIDLLRRITNIDIDMNSSDDGFRIHYWTPNDPNLYDIKYSLYKGDELKEEIGSYFGFRHLGVKENILLMNNNPIYLKMVLHQGYYKNSGLTRPSNEALLKDILLAKEIGFNGMRMHQKIEEELFYYYADVYGMLIWCEMPSCYEFKDDTVTNLYIEWMRAVKQNYNHPSIVAWVPINESWGVPRVVLDKANQSLTLGLYYMTKSYDPYRIVISNDGWEHTKSDIITLHNYAQEKEELVHFYGNMKDVLDGNHFVDYSQTRVPFAEGFHYDNQPVIISEFGGTGYKTVREDGWGYSKLATSEEEYLNKVKGLVEAIRENDRICGYCYTQLTDVDQEINGLLDMERKPKVSMDKLKEIFKK